MSSNGYTVSKRDIDVAAGVAQTATFPLQLIPTTAMLSVTSTATNATVTVDGKTKGLAPFTIEVKGGGHTVEVSATGYTTRSQEVQITPGENRNVPLDLDKIVVAHSAWYKSPALYVTLGVVLIGGGAGLYFAEQKPAPIVGTLQPGVGAVGLRRP